MVQAGGSGSRMDVLTRERAKPALPFAGSHQLVDFALSALAGSGVTDVWLSVQFRAGSLHGHVAGGRPWDLDRTRGGLRWLVPEEGGGSPAKEGFAEGNAEDLYRYVDAIRGFGADAVVVTSADQVFSLDLRPVVAEHLERGVDCTLVTTETSRTRAREKVVVDVARDGRVRAVAVKPDDPTGTTVCAEVFVYRPEALTGTLSALRAELAPGADGGSGLGDFGDHLLPRLVREGTVRTHPLPGYWADCGTPAAYLQAHRDLVAGRVDVFDHPGRPVLSRWPERPPARVDDGARVVDSWLAPGAVVRGTVRRSVVGPGAVVERGAVVTDAVLFADVHVERDARVTSAVLDTGVVVGRGARVGAATRATRLVDDHVTLVGAGSTLAPGVRVPRGGRLEPGTTA